MKRILSIILLGMLWLSPKGNTQSILTLDQAISLALSKNEEIQVAKMNEDLMDRQVYKANAGMSPRVDWNLNAGTSFNKVNQEFVDGRIINRNGRTIFPNTNITVQYPIYDGRQMQNRYKLLQSEAAAQQYSTEVIQDNIVTLVIDQYTAIQRQKANLTFLETNLTYYQERYRIVNQRWEGGKIAKPELLQSQNDLTTQQNLIQIAGNQLVELKGSLNTTLYRPYETEFDIEDLQDKTSLTTLEEALNKLLEQDEIIALFEANKQALTINRAILAGQQKPRIGAQASLGYNLSNTNAGLILLNQNTGVTGLITASWNLFDGGHIRRQKEIIDLRYQIVERQKAAYVTTAKSRIQSAMFRLSTAQAITQSYSENVNIAKENLDIILEKLKLGATTPLEVSDAQQRYNQAGQAMINSRFDVVQAYWVLQRLME
jgi:outer membrane protein